MNKWKQRFMDTMYGQSELKWRLERWMWLIEEDYRLWGDIIDYNQYIRMCNDAGSRLLKIIDAFEKERSK